MKRNNFKFIILVSWIVILLCLISVVMMIKIYLIDNYWGHDWDYLIYSLPVLISAIIFLMFLYNLKRAYHMQRSDLGEGNNIAYWTYGEDEWVRFNYTEWQKVRNKCIWFPLLFLLLFFVFAMLDGGINSEVLRVSWPYVTYFLVSISAILLFYNYMMYNRTKKCPREVLIGPKGFLYGGFYNSWDLTGTYLAGIRFIQDPFPKLEFDIRVWSKYGYNSQPLRIPIPRGKEAEAEEVISELTTCISVPPQKNSG